MAAMNATLGAPEIVFRIELTCFYCGHSCGELKVRTAGRPTYGAIRAAYGENGSASAPDWDAHGQPRCPRCRGKLFVEENDRRVSPARV